MPRENELPKAFNQYFTKAGAAPNHGTRSTTKNCICDCNGTRIHNHLIRKQTLNHLAKLAVNTKTTTYGKDSLKSQSIKVWNNLQTKNDIDILDINRSKAKTKITNQFLNSYTLIDEQPVWRCK